MLGKAKKPIVLGCTVKDRVSGFAGMTIAKHERLGGNVMWSVQPKTVEKKGEAITMPEAVAFDYHMLEFTGDGISKDLPAVDTTCVIKVGEAVEDTITEYQGTVTEVNTYQNGCIHLTVEGPVEQAAKNSLGLVQSRHFLHSRLKRVGDGVTKNARLFPKEPGTGGPNIRNARQRYSQRG